MAALNIKNIPTGAGDDIKIDATYAKGDTKNVISTSGASPNFAMFSGSGNGAYQSIGFGATTDGVYLPGSTDGIKLTEAYGVRGAFNTTGIRTGRPACSAATLPCGMVATRPTSPLPRVLIALCRQQCRCEVSGFLLQSGLQRIAARCGYALDSRQEPDVLG
jgi:hypothetical protein